ncbi:MAG TPA: c-type cytochrome [Rubrivivax sp.]|nr:c-type cytochrome [Rubrivivax sp.]
MKTALTLTLVLFGAVSMAQAQEIKGDAAAGAKLNATCIGCHGIAGYQSSFPEVHRVPMISGQNAKYIAAALNAYKKGDRKHGTMHAVAAPLSEQDIANLAAYYEKHGQSVPADDAAAGPPSPAVAALLAKGACVSCHGANFSKPIDGAYPKIAGQHADYLYVAMKSYKIEGNPKIGRNNAIMVGQMKQFSTKELRLLAEYIGSLPSELHTIPQSKFR